LGRVRARVTIFCITVKSFSNNNNNNNNSNNNNNNNNNNNSNKCLLPAQSLTSSSNSPFNGSLKGQETLDGAGKMITVIPSLLTDCPVTSSPGHHMDITVKVSDLAIKGVSLDLPSFEIDIKVPCPDMTAPPSEWKHGIPPSKPIVLVGGDSCSGDSSLNAS